jgi:hypothetical protein
MVVTEKNINWIKSDGSVFETSDPDVSIYRRNFSWSISNSSTGNLGNNNEVSVIKHIVTGDDSDSLLGVGVSISAGIDETFLKELDAYLHTLDTEQKRQQEMEALAICSVRKPTLLIEEDRISLVTNQKGTPITLLSMISTESGWNIIGNPTLGENGKIKLDTNGEFEGTTEDNYLTSSKYDKEGLLKEFVFKTYIGHITNGDRKLIITSNIKLLSPDQIIHDPTYISAESEKQLVDGIFWEKDHPFEIRFGTQEL